MATHGGVSENVQVPPIDPSELEIGEMIGDGCFGTVYRGRCRGQDVAIKKLRVQQYESEVLEEFKKEISVVTHLRHPDIVQFLGACMVPGHLAIVTEYMDGGDLAKIISDKVNLSIVQKCVIARDIAKAMRWCHESKPPVIHRDLKPSNLLVTADLHVKLCDFGLSAFQWTKTLQDDETAPGTPLWMAPEVLMGRPLSEKVDVYSFGIVLWELFTYKEPFDTHDNYEKFVEAVCLYHERPPLKKLVHPSIANLISSTWHPTPSERLSMSKLIPLIENVMIEASVPCPHAVRIWKEHFLGKTEVPFPVFAEHFFAALGEVRDFNGQKYKCLHRLLSERNLHTKTDVVFLERFALVLTWLGPLKISGEKGNFFDRMMNLLRQPWFHGDCQREVCEASLQSSKKKPAFSVRFSFNNPDQTPFTISKIDKKGVISHQRVHAIRDGGLSYYVMITYKKEEKRVLSPDGSLDGLIKNVSKDLELTYPCGGQYLDIFRNADVAVKNNGYIAEAQQVSDASESSK
eukprot:TRINITY_DN3460_c0_g1_i2.p1 TRINITY_DN3460_c0_g1~~TRINITY_DN3460_c0_g1_i2.p1  ORF type:complete len:540 (-),score=90.46 TRINITY_DN3460_c0_g1_i2:85-1635(-)